MIKGSPYHPFRLVVLIGVLAMLFCPGSVWAQDFTNLKEKKPFDAGGSISLNTAFYANTGGGNNFPFGKIDPFHWSIVGTPWISIYEWTIPFTFTIGKQNQSFEHPFYQFGVSPTYKWLTLHAGYRNMRFNPYTLNGHTFLGGGIEMNPGRFRFAAMAGLMNQAVEYDTTKQDFEEPKYQRLGFGAKIGYGTEDNWADIMFFKAKDKASSISDPPMDQDVDPGENLAIGISTSQKIVDALTWYADLGLSLFTRDINADNFYEGTGNAINKLDFLITPNITTRINYALKTGINLQVKTFRMSAEYERVMPEYETMGSYFFANDFNKIKISPTVSLAKSKVRISTNYAIRWNNLQDTRLQTTYNSNGTINIDINPKPLFGVNLSYSNFYTFQKAGTLPKIDSVSMDLMTHAVNVIPRLTFIKPTFIQTYVLTASYQTLVDGNSKTSMFTETNSLNLTLNGVFNWVKAKHTLNGGPNFLRTQTFIGDQLKIGFNVGYSTKLADDQVSLRVQANFSSNRLNGSTNGHSEGLQTNFGYTIKKMHTFSVNLQMLNNSFKSSPGYTEFRGAASYMFTLAGIVPEKGSRKGKRKSSEGDVDVVEPIQGGEKDLLGE